MRWEKETLVLTLYESMAAVLTAYVAAVLTAYMAAVLTAYMAAVLTTYVAAVLTTYVAAVLMQHESMCGSRVLFLCCSELQKTLDERTGRLAELEQEVEVMRGELSAAHEATKQAPSKTLRALVDKLRDQLSIKEKQHQVLYGKEAGPGNRMY